MPPSFERPEDKQTKLNEVLRMIRDTREEIRRLSEELGDSDTSDAVRKSIGEKLEAAKRTLETLLFDEAELVSEIKHSGSSPENSGV